MRSKVYLIFLFLLILSGNAEATDDSTGVTVKEGRTYVLHKVEKGEGLFSISRKYQVDRKLIQESNPGCEQGLQLNQILWIPRTYKYTATKEVEIQKKNTSSTSQSDQVSEADEPKKYTVLKGETLYSISRKLGVSVKELKDLNQFSSDDLQEGAEIIVSIKDKNEMVKVEKKAEEGKTIDKKTELIAENNNEDKPENLGGYTVKTEILAEFNAKRTIEQGLCVITKDKSIARSMDEVMHHNAPVNTILRITNPKNNLTRYVKVTGNFKRNSAQDPILKISKKTAELLEIEKEDPFEIVTGFAN
ncbi:MAG: LysM peptidoglycan-binding domain-containing protein [Flavobacteriales bacterium]|nr:LysM peptidoglycan-binding domain-containing protein [Flavobacteriales bacterium]